MPEKILGFSKEYRFLSNFAISPVVLDDIVYPTVENAYQAAKTLNDEERLPFICYTAKDAKKYGQKLPLREDWDAVKLLVMERLVRQKFAISELREKLLATGDAYLEETNWWGDQYWGVCNGVGENHLGKILMKVRAEIRNAVGHE